MLSPKLIFTDADWVRELRKLAASRRFGLLHDEMIRNQLIEKPKTEEKAVYGARYTYLAKSC